LSGKAFFKDSGATKVNRERIINPLRLVEAPATSITAGESDHYDY
jgi:hypothetical protein